MTADRRSTQLQCATAYTTRIRDTVIPLHGTAAPQARTTLLLRKLSYHVTYILGAQGHQQHSMRERNSQKELGL